MPTRMAAVDAQFYWMSAKLPNNEFLFYAFGGEPTDFDRAVDDVRSRAQACPALAVRVDDGSPLTYPHWVPTAVEPEWVIHHHLDDGSWRGCLDAVVRLVDDQLDMRRAPWRLHLFAPVHGLPGYTGPGTVAVMQFAHALADGARLAALAGWLFGRSEPVPEVTALSPGFMPWRAVDAARTHRTLMRDIRAGLLAPPFGTRPALSTNTRPTGARTLRTLVRHRSALRGPTVTVAVLAAVSAALAGHLADATPSMIAEVTMAKTGVRQAHNHFFSATVGLYPDLVDKPESSGSPKTWPTPAVAHSTLRRRRPTGPSPLCLLRCCAGVSAGSILTPDHPRCPATPWCQVSTTGPTTCASAVRRCC